MISKDEVDNTSTDEMGDYVRALVYSKIWPGIPIDHCITPDNSDRRHVVAVSSAVRDWDNTTPGVPLPAVSMEVMLASEQRFRVTVEEIW